MLCARKGYDMSALSRNNRDTWVVRSIRNDGRRKPADILFGRSGTPPYDSPRINSVYQEHHNQNSRVSAAAIVGSSRFTAQYRAASLFGLSGTSAWQPTQMLFGLSGTPCSQTAGRQFGLSRTVSVHREQNIGLSGTNHRPIGNALSAYQEQPPPEIADWEPISIS